MMPLLWRRKSSHLSSILIGSPSWLRGSLLAVLSPFLVIINLNASQDRFSHSVHLTRAALQCVDCHAAAAESARAEDNNLPRIDRCLGCHDGVEESIIDSNDYSRNPVQRTFRFDHRFHLQFGNLAPLLARAMDSGTYLGRASRIREHLNTGNHCEACHRGLHESEDLGMPQMSDCLVCHSEIDNPFSCATCHLKGVQLRPEDHTLEFVDRHASKDFEYESDTCLPCHGTNFVCRGCH